jgi:hypothetical protein
MNKFGIIIIIITYLFISKNAAAQADSTALQPREDTTAYIKNLSKNFGNFPKQALATLDQLSINGYYRFIANYRQLQNSYAHLANNRNNIFVGDDSQIPQLMLNISGSAGGNTSFGTDLFLWTPMTGAGQIENVKGLNLGVSLYGTHITKHGEFNVRTGGINWYTLSPFTFQSNKGYDRYSIFERNPWDPNTPKAISRYESFYNVGAINQDLRWGQQAFQGIIAEGNRLPYGLSTSIMYGKTQLDGGLQPLPNNSFGGKIKKEYGNNFISLNTFNNRSFTDSTQRATAGFNVITTEFKQKVNKVLFTGEVGMGRFFANENTNNWGELLSLKMAYSIKNKVPIEVHLYRISPKVINNSAMFINASIQQNVASAPGVQLVLPAVASALTNIGQLVNNRQGIEINAQVNYKKFKNSIGYANSVELQNISNQLTYGHPINALVLSRFWRWNFPSNIGPYNNLSRVYRGIYETVNLTDINDTSKVPNKRKYFNSIELNSKYNFKLNNKDIYVFYLGQYSSAQNKAAPITVFTEQALLRTYYHQLELYYGISKNIVLSTYLGAERIIANYNTQVDVQSLRPKNQTGTSIAFGADAKLSKGAGLYVKQRWFNYKDSSFAKDKFNGWESTIELKIFF